MRFCIVLLLLAQASCVRTERSPLAKAAQYLWSEQANDGGWHSHTYGLLRSGQSLTPFVLDALLRVPAGVYPPPAGKIDAAISFIVKHTQSDGSLGMADPGLPDYPNYATALAVSALSRARREEDASHIQRMAAYLRSQQFTEQNGWHPNDPVYGAWGMGGTRRTPPDTGHVDLSMTKYVLEALRASGIPASDPLFDRARIFVERCQNFDPQKPDDADGGFYFSTTEFDTNKAGHDGKHFRSYGTTTADGILALLATGRQPGDPRIIAAQRWLISHHRNMDVPGFIGEPYQKWTRGLAFYYASASTQAYEALHIGLPAGVVESLDQTQKANGAWANPENLVKEDDPLIATAFAVHALSVAR